MQPIAAHVHIEHAADCVEPIGRPGLRWRGRIDVRARAVLTTAIVTAVAVNAGTLWAYLKVT